MVRSTAQIDARVGLCRCRPGRALRTGGLVSATLTLALMAGCGGGSNTAGHHGGGKGSTSPPVATVRAPQQDLTIVDASGPSAQSLAVSQALFTSAPVVVVARAGDPASVTAAATAARQRGAPLLLTPAASAGSPSSSTNGAAPTSPGAASTPAPPAAATSSSPSAEPVSRVPPDLRAELKRLDPKAVLAVGAVAGPLRAALHDTDVTSDPAKLPGTGQPASVGDLTVLVSAADDDEGARAAAATAAAAGATVVPVHGTDPRGDADAVTALAQHKSSHVLAVGPGFGPAKQLEARLAVAETGTMLPGGGQVMFPGRRLVAMYGHPGTPSLGVLGEQGLDASIQRAAQIAAPYKKLSDVPVVPSFEILATVAAGSPGRDGNYSTESSVASLTPWVKAAGAHGMYVVLDLQPGRANLLDQAKLYQSLLTLPYVGLALDPEWKLQPGQTPLHQIGTVDAPEINSVIDWLAELTTAHHLPQKLLVLHQFRLSMIGHEQDIDLSHDSLSILIHMDGQGAPSLKQSTWDTITKAAPTGIWFGFKDFYGEDHPMLTPTQTVAHKPTPVMISYQ